MVRTQVMISLVLMCTLPASATTEGGSLTFKSGESGSSNCAISNVGGTLVAGCGADTPQNLLSSDTTQISDIQNRLDFLADQAIQNMPCLPGSVRNTTRDVDPVCETCPKGFFNPEMDYTTACTPCPDGYTTNSSSDHSYCDVCAPGYGFNGGTFDASHTFCNACDVNEYQSGADRNSCSSCPNEAHTNGQNTQSSCTFCDAGFERTEENEAGHAVCSACDAGKTYATSSMDTCEEILGCPLGQGLKIPLADISVTSSDTASYCESCSAETEYSDQDNLSACEDHEPCPAGQGVSEDSLNPAGQAVVFSSDAPVVCENCPAEKYSASNVFHKCWSVEDSAHIKTVPSQWTDHKVQPLQCAPNYFSSGQITYVSSTGKKAAAQMCHLCATCTTTDGSGGLEKTACNTNDGRGLDNVQGSQTVCCDGNTDKPDFATFDSDGENVMMDTLNDACKFNCDDGYQFDASTSQCVVISTAPVVTDANMYCTWTQYAFSSRKSRRSYTEAQFLEACQKVTQDNDYSHFVVNNNYNPSSSSNQCWVCLEPLCLPEGKPCPSGASCTKCSVSFQESWPDYAVGNSGWSIYS